MYGKLLNYAPWRSGSRALPSQSGKRGSPSHSGRLSQSLTLRTAFHGVLLWALLVPAYTQCTGVPGCPINHICCQLSTTEYSIRLTNPSQGNIHLGFIPSASTVSGIDVSYSYLGTIPQGLCGFTTLRRLSLRNNFIKTLGNTSLSCLTQLEILDISGNQLKVVYDNTFLGNTKITTVDLSRNQIGTVERNAFTSVLTQLDEVYLDYNLLTAVYPWPQTINTLTTASLMHNDISTIIYDAQMISQSAAVLSSGHTSIQNYAYNNFTTYDISLFYTVGVTNVSGLHVINQIILDFRYNPFHCGCDSYDTISAIQGFYEQYMTQGTLGFSFLYDTVTCASPNATFGASIATTNVSEIRCPATSGCSSACGCGYAPHSQQTFVTCSNQGLTGLPATVPSGPVVIKLEGGAIVSLDNVAYLENITELYVGNNLIAYISDSTAQRLSGVKVLELHGNRLQTLPKAVISVNYNGLQQLSIHDNPLACSCETDWVRGWLKKHRTALINADDILCADGTNALVLQDSAWCSMQAIHYMAVGLVLIGLMMSISAISVIKSNGNMQEVAPDDGDSTPRFNSARSRLVHVGRMR